MEENPKENISGINTLNTDNVQVKTTDNSGPKVIAGAIILAGVIIAGAIMLKGGSNSVTSAPVATNGAVPVATTLAKVGPSDRVLGNPQAKVALVLYEDFQCPFCGKLFNEVEQNVKTSYVNTGKVEMVYRDFAFLGTESTRAAEAARCAGDQSKFWEYHDYLFTHQNGENQGHFSDTNLKSFAKSLSLNTTDFNSCFDSNKYAQAVADSKNEGGSAGVQGTPKGFILRDGKVVSTIDGAESLGMVTQKLDAALK